MTEETASSSVILVFGFGGGASLSRVDAGAARLAQVALSYDDLTADAADIDSALRPLTEDSIATIACEVSRIASRIDLRPHLCMRHAMLVAFGFPLRTVVEAICTSKPFL